MAIDFASQRDLLIEIVEQLKGLREEVSQAKTVNVSMGSQGVMTLPAKLMDSIQDNSSQYVDLPSHGFDRSSLIFMKQDGKIVLQFRDSRGNTYLRTIFRDGQ